ncbi:MAG: PAS domain S-box protein [Alphaproteobacteria bacterium]|nr:PAS domain S-box protein [Alphaproteobacteria bacterium]MBV8410477.1 PAS domain S-box protein [Alphaproteobacteria bacterium]
MYRLIIGLILAAILLTIGAGGALLLNLGRFRESFGLVEHTDEVLRTIWATEVALFQAESDGRAWVLSADKNYLKFYQREATIVGRSLRSLANLVNDSREQAERLKTLDEMAQARLSAFARVVELGPGRRDEALAILATERQRRTGSSIAEALEEMRTIEMDELAKRRNNTDTAAVYTTVAASALTLLAILGASIGAYLFQRQRSLRELRRAKTYLEAILATVPDGMIGFDGSGVIDSFNSIAEGMFQLSATEARGRRLASLFETPGADDVEALLARSQARQDGRAVPTTRELTAKRKDGSLFPVEIYVSAVSSEGGMRFIAFLRDLSERQVRERQAEKLRSELLHVSRLINMGEMASALAHELNQPLTALAAYMQGAEHLLSEGAGNNLELVRSAMQKATAQALRAGDVIRRLREFVGRGETDRGVESLVDMVREAWALASVTDKDPNVRFETRLDPAADQVLVNRIQIEQVLLNLVRNGLEAMKEAIEKHLVIASEPAPNGMVRVSVADRGSGIAPEVAARLFQSFVTSKTSGLGMGLSISRTIVEAHGGRIWAEANPAGGTIFRFTLRSGVLRDEADDGC